MKKINFKLLQNEKGVSLVEVVASIVILTIILISFASFLPQMGKTNNQNEEKQQAVNLAQKEFIHWKNNILEPDNVFGAYFQAGIDSFPPTHKFKFNDNGVDKEITVELKKDVDTISFITGSQDTDYQLKIIIKVKPDLNNGDYYAYQTTVIIFDDKNKNISETYGYIFY